MGKEQYLTEAHYLTCTNGMYPLRMKIDGKRTTKFSGSLAANANDLQRGSNFTCVGKVAFAAGFVAGFALGVAALIPGPGWVVAAIIAAAILAAMVIARLKCKAAAATRFWNPALVSSKVNIDGNAALTLSSQMVCPNEGGCITASPTLWSAWGKQTLSNLGHIANFAFGFLAGRGCGAMLAEGVTAAGGLGSLGSKEGLKKFGKEVAGSFWNTAKNELKEQFNPFGGWKNRSWICNGLRGLGLFGAYKQQWDIWTDEEKSLLDKVQTSAVGLILDVFAAKGMTYTCFPAGTKVHTQWGLANIERLDAGVPVLTYNELTGQQEYKKVLKVSRRMAQRMCVIELSNGEMMEVTPEHRFFCGGEWVAVEDLQKNNTLQARNGDLLVIENKIIVTKFVEVFNLEVEDNENYYVTEDGILVHNGYKKKATVKDVDASTHDVEITISKSDYPETAQHIEDAINSGQPDIITIQRDMADANRKASLDGYDTKKGFDRDEWPMAMFSEGGSGADISYINPSDNRGAGSAIGHALTEYPNRTKVKIIIID